jgi:hypothetical protein
MSTQTIAPPAQRIRQLDGVSAPQLPRDLPRLAERHGAGISQPWRSRMWPCSAEEERMFVEELDDSTEVSTDEFDRRDVTSLVTALRSGLTAARLLDSARGLKAARLVAAYVELDRRRCVSVEAWRSIAVERTAEVLERKGPTAALLLRGLVGQVVRDVQRTGDVTRIVNEAAVRVDRSTKDVLALEHQLALDATPVARIQQIAEMLNDGGETGAWNLATFLPSRVGSMVPLRVAALLGESRPHDAT